MNKGSNALSGHMFNALQQPPNIPIYNEDNESGYNITSTGTIGQWDNNKAVGAQLPNIMMVLDKNYYKSNRRRNVINGFAEADIIEGITYRFQVRSEECRVGTG